MEELLNEFLNDLKHIEKMGVLVESLVDSNSIRIEEDIDKEKYKKLIDLHNESVNAKVPLKILPGIILPYLGGRFENFVRNIFEEICSVIATNVKTYNELPKPMKKNLIDYTAEVIANPRKYGHGDKGVEAFIKILNENINNNNATLINTSCLSITYENMKPDTLKSLFERIGMKDIWVVISEQSHLKLLLRESDSGKTKSLSEKHLKEFMDKRNMIAHPSSGITWPSTEEIAFYVKYFECLGKSLVDACNIYSIKYDKVEEMASGE